MVGTTAPTTTFPTLSRLALFAHAKIRERMTVLTRSIAKISAYTFEHLLFMGGLAAIAYGAWEVWRPLGPILGGWFMVRVAMLIAAERDR